MSSRDPGAAGARDILVVDDEPENLDLLVRALRTVGSVVRATSGGEALEHLRERDVAAIVTDHRMPQMTGVELLERAARVAPKAARILVSAYADVDVLTEAINRGHVSHFVPKPIDVGELRDLVIRTLRAAVAATHGALVLADGDTADLVEAALTGRGLHVARPRDLSAPRSGDVLLWDAEVSVPVLEDVRRAVHRAGDRPRTGHGLGEVIGQSSAMTQVFEQVEKVAPSDATVLLRGETGTGKELVARIIHSLSRRRDGPFVAVNCAAIPEALVESELFGHERGAFTGAQARRAGRFERADGGTLFVDEVGDVPLAVQVKLLRALQERSFERVGGTDTLTVDIRLIAATNLDLEAALADGRFREDLFYRLNVVPIALPPLRDRPEDIPLLVDHLLERCQERVGKRSIRVAPALMDRLRAHDWPGNVRELMNVVERIVALTPSGATADSGQVPARAPRERLSALIPEEPAAPLKSLVGDFERRVVAQALERRHGNRTRAARDLGLTRQGLSLKIKKYGL